MPDHPRASTPVTAPEPSSVPSTQLTFVDPTPGPVPPATRFLTVELGKDRIETVRARVSSLGLECADTSIRAQMAAKRQAERKRIDEAEARGEDGVTAASWLGRKSSREQNPQVRFACQNVDAQKLPDRTRLPSRGRVLYIFDSEEHPVRHASYQRRHRDQTRALDDLEETLDGLQNLYGPPSSTRGELPQRGPDGAVAFANLRPYEALWTFSGLQVKVHALLYGRTVTISERVEVPHGVRPDAPVWVRTPANAARD